MSLNWLLRNFIIGFDILLIKGYRGCRFVIYLADYCVQVKGDGLLNLF